MRGARGLFKWYHLVFCRKYKEVCIIKLFLGGLVEWLLHIISEMKSLQISVWMHGSIYPPVFGTGYWGAFNPLHLLRGGST